MVNGPTYRLSLLSGRISYLPNQPLISDAQNRLKTFVDFVSAINIFWKATFYIYHHLDSAWSQYAFSSRDGFDDSDNAYGNLFRPPADAFISCIFSTLSTILKHSFEHFWSKNGIVPMVLDIGVEI